VALFRPSDTRLDAGERAEGLPVRIVDISGRGAVRSVECQSVSGHHLIAEIAEAAASRLEVGQKARLSARRVVIEAAEGRSRVQTAQSRSRAESAAG
jgi:hypothetical protein